MRPGVALRSPGRILCCGMVLGAAVLAAGCEDPAVRFNRMGLEAYRAGEYTRAAAAFEEAAHHNPEAGEYYFNRGMSEQALGQIDRAIFTYGLAVRLSPGIVQAYQNTAQCYLQKGMPDKALETLETGATSNPYTGEAFLNVGRFYVDRKDLAMARLWYAKAVAADPDNSLAHRDYGRLLLRLGEREKGIEHLRKSWDLQPIQPDVSAELTELAPTGDQLPPPKPQNE